MAFPRSRCPGAVGVAWLVAAIGSSCSTVPDDVLPPHVDHAFHATYRVGTDGRLAFPVTTRDLVIRDLQLSPEPGREEFGNEGRWFVYPTGTTVHARGSLRIYATDDGSQPKLRDVLPGATLLPVVPH